ncbi:MAG TPA: M23 family metallopeptidase [Pyrinomonadaceae bacterium]
MCSPTPDNSKRHQSNTLFKLPLLLTLIVLSLLSSAPLAAAQEGRPRSVDSQQQQQAATQEEQSATRRADNTASAQRESTSRTQTAPVVKKTVMIYTPPAENRGAPRPALVDDIVIISRAEEDVPASGRNQLVRPTSIVRAVAASANMPSIWPVSGITTGNFGVRSNPFGGMSSEFHKGQDISAPIGTVVMATADGVVVTAGWQRGYGRVVYVDHGNGISTRYGHLSRIDVAVGQTIKRGEQLGLVGSSGRSTGPHLHYEVRINGAPANPGEYLPIITTTTTPATTTAAPVQKKG